MELDKLRQNIFNSYNDFANSFLGYIKEQLEDEELLELHEYLTSANGLKKSETINVDTLKLMASIQRVSDTDAKIISEYIKSNVYGWQGDRYIFSNRCLMDSTPEQNCKYAAPLKTIELVERIISDITKIFFNDECGQITLLLFSYCLSALFASKLNDDKFSPPYYLQIGCIRSTAIYRLIDTIVDICDVNAGLLDKCMLVDANSKFKTCDYANHKYYPTPYVDTDISNILHDNRDMPLIISGFENKRYYNVLMRRIINISNQTRTVDLREKFNVIPIFVCEEINDGFDNVLSIDLSDFDISQDYLNCVIKNKQILSSWVFKLISNHKTYLFRDRHQGLESRLYFKQIAAYSNIIEGKYPDLALKNTRNVAYLNFFFKGVMNVFHNLSTAVENEKIYILGSDGQTYEAIAKGWIKYFIDMAEKSLVNLHRNYLPTSTGTGIIDKNAISLARKIEKIYQTLNTHIRVVPTEVMPDRYIFDIETLQNTKEKDITQNRETVQRRLKIYEFFRIDLSNPMKTKLIVAEKTPQDNNLIEIFEHESFKNAKMEIPYAIGYDESGLQYVEDIGEFPHLLLLGTTKSGKSTAMISLLMSIANKHKTGEVNVIIMDFLGKDTSDYSVFNDHPFMLHPVITNTSVGVKIIYALYNEMKRRVEGEKPHIVCVIDEFPRLFKDINIPQKEIKDFQKSLKDKITDLLSGGRHSNIHIIAASQSLSQREMIIETNNFPAIMYFRFPTFKISEQILGRRGLEKLHGNGDMIFRYNGEDKRLQGSYIDKNEMIKILEDTKRDFKQGNYTPFKLEEINIENDSLCTDNHEELYDDGKDKRFRTVEEILPAAIMWALSQKKIATRNLLSKFEIGDPKGQAILKGMKNLGIIEKLSANKGWKVLFEKIEDVSEDTITLLENSGYTREEIENTFAEKINPNTDNNTEKPIEQNTATEDNIKQTHEPKKKFKKNVLGKDVIKKIKNDPYSPKNIEKVKNKP